MMSPFSLQGRVVLMTGATGGIGEPTARLLAEAGAKLILSSHQSEALSTLCADLPNDARALPCDLSDRKAVEPFARQAEAIHGRVDVLICNAGVEGPVGPIGTAPQADMDRLLAINLYSAITLSGSLAPGMGKRGSGSIVLVSSIAGVRGNRSIGAYGIAKAGLTQLARNLAVEWGPLGVRANAVAPGLIETGFAAPILDDAARLERRLSLTPLRRVGSPEEIAACILFLAGDAAGFVSGHNLVVDGGTTISDGS